MTRLARFLAPVLLTAAALLTVPATAPAAAAPTAAARGTVPAQKACGPDWVANAGDYTNPDHLNVIDVSATNGDIGFFYKGSNSNGRYIQSASFYVPSGWDMFVWDNRTSTPVHRTNSTGWHPMFDNICGGVFWLKGVHNGAGMDRAVH